MHQSEYSCVEACNKVKRLEQFLTGTVAQPASVAVRRRVRADAVAILPILRRQRRLHEVPKEDPRRGAVENEDRRSAGPSLEPVYWQGDVLCVRLEAAQRRWPIFDGNGGRACFRMRVGGIGHREGARVMGAS